MEYIIEDIIKEFSPLVNIDDREIRFKIDNYILKIKESYDSPEVSALKKENGRLKEGIEDARIDRDSTPF